MKNLLRVSAVQHCMLAAACALGATACGDDGQPMVAEPDSGKVDASASRAGSVAPTVSVVHPVETPDAAETPDAGGLTDAAATSDGGGLTDAAERDAGGLTDAEAPAVGDASADADVVFDPQLPPTDPVLAEAWLDAGFYKDWACEAVATTKTDGNPAIHVHGASSRICANNLLAATPAVGTASEFPKGVAAVKEVYDAEHVLTARYLEVKTAAASDGGNGWYWLKDGGAVSGFGVAMCTSCHGAAGSDADHPGAGDHVYWQQTATLQ